MAQGPVRETAEIIPFPKRNRVTKPMSRDGARQGGDRGAVVVCDYGSGWYHDAAVQADLPKRPTPH